MGGIMEAALEEVILAQDPQGRQIGEGERAVPEAEGGREKGHDS